MSTKKKSQTRNKRNNPPRRKQPVAKTREVADTAPAEQQLLTMEQAIESLRTTRPTFYRWLRGGKIKGLKVGRQWRFRREDVERFLSGAEPRIELRADIDPLIVTLRERLAEAGAVEIDRRSSNQIELACTLMLQVAFATRASDLHLATHIAGAAEGERGYLRMRIDGVLRMMAELDARLVAPPIEQWKINCSCDPRETERPQDGRIVFQIGRDTHDARIAFLPSSRGETMLVRFVHAALSAQDLDLDRFPFSANVKSRLDAALKGGWGMIAVSGPSGSGKTSTLYACLSRVSGPQVQTITVEDPIEFQIPWATQTETSKTMNLTSLLRAALRSDPDVIMVGEQRDKDSVVLAQMAAKTGHLVLTSFHSIDATNTLQYMIQMSGNPLIAADSVKLIVAQRLVRKLCPDCRKTCAPTEYVLNAARKLSACCHFPWDKIGHGTMGPVGCSKCGQTGFRGRTLVAEALVMSPAIATALQRDATSDELREIAQQEGMIPLAFDALRLVEEGTTSLAEVISTFGAPLVG